MQRLIRIVFLDFRKAFDLIDHNKLLENTKEMVVRSVLIRWFASYLNERSHFAQLVKKHLILLMLPEVSRSCKLGPIAFVIKINTLPSVIEQVVAQGVNDDVVVDENTILFMHDKTIWKALDVHYHRNISKKIDLVKDFAESEKMELNPEKCFLRNVDRFSKR